MPKEYVFQSTKYGDPDTQRPAARIGWSREPGHVEIATVMPDGIPLDGGPEANGWFLQLDRDGINRLIRLLRKARDAAYGADA
jgi:hypothetical protein